MATALACSLLALSLCLPPQPAKGDPTGVRFRGISNVEVSVGIGRASSNLCPLDRQALERFGVQRLRQAGVHALTSDDVTQLSRQSGEQLQRDLEVMRSGRRLPGSSSTTPDERHSAIMFLRNLPFLMIQFETEKIALGDGKIFCAIATSGDFAAPPAGTPTIAATGQPNFAPLLLWRHPVLAAVSAPEEVQQAAAQQLDIIVQRMLRTWREQNPSEKPR